MNILHPDDADDADDDDDDDDYDILLSTGWFQERIRA